jgi:Ca2+-binding RTX toxin-like protein
MATVSIHSSSGVDYESYIAAFGSVDPLVATASPIVGGTTITISLGLGRSIVFSGVFTGSQVSNGAGAVTQMQFLLDPGMPGLPVVTVATATGITFTLEELRSGVQSGDAALRAVLFADAYIFNGGSGPDRFVGGDQGDTLSGASGNDTLVGGNGNDTYVNPTSGDTIIELNGALGGIDTVLTGTSYSIANMAGLEDIKLTRTGDINATGNAGINRLTGNTGNNVLNGGAGNDIMIGGRGNDTYHVDSASDQTIEYGATGAGEGIDLVSSSVSRTLSLNIENLTLIGATHLQGNGNTLNNIITGNTGDNVLRGYEGTDTLNGRAGADILLGGLGRDTLNPGVDTVRDILRFGGAMDSSGTWRDMVVGMDINGEDVFDFPAIPIAIVSVAVGVLNAATFNPNLAAAVNAALAPNGAVIFDPSAGDQDIAGHSYLVVDADGNGTYSSGIDYVVELVNPTGTLTLDDFI